MKRIYIIFFGLFIAAALPAVEYLGPDGISFDLPEGWSAFGDASSETFSFSNADHTAFLQVFRFQSDPATSIEVMYGYVKAGLGASGDQVPYSISGNDGVFASITFTAAGNPVTGYAICYRAEAADIAAIAYAPVEGDYKDELLSALDSIAFAESELAKPGAVSQFMLAPENHDATAAITIGTFSTTFPIDTGEFEVAQLIVEREARLLARSSGENIDTWKRYYRIIYRDNYSRLGLLGDRFAQYASTREDRPLAEELLVWLQSFTYERTGTLSDLLNPYESSLREIGDCDSRALIYAILLHYAGIDASLLVSEVYQHAVCAVGVPGEGAVISTGKGPQVIAETTDDVALGLIAADQADPSGWIVVDLDGKRGPK